MANGDEVIKQRRNNEAQDQIGSDEIRGKNANNSKKKEDNSQNKWGWLGLVRAGESQKFKYQKLIKQKLK